jgi:hypothetical protein
MRQRLTAALERAPSAVITVYAVLFAFATYFAMYAFRKPFAAASFGGAISLGPIEIDRKGALIIGQLCGYALSKLVGVKLNSELPHARRLLALVAVIAVAEGALLLFAVSSPGLQVAAMFVNGLPLGTVWGICFSFLEGRRTSEILGAGLSCAYVVASGVVKSIGKSLLDAGVSEDWMPAVCGAIFWSRFLLFAFASAWCLPGGGRRRPANAAEPMNSEARRHFARATGRASSRWSSPTCSSLPTATSATTSRPTSGARWARAGPPSSPRPRSRSRSACCSSCRSSTS